MSVRDFFGRRFFTSITLLALAASFPFLASAMSDSPQFILALEKDNDATLTLHKGQELKVRLETKLGTGYSWHIARLDTHYLTLLEETIQPGPDKPLPGGAEFHVFRFEAKASGRTEIEIRYLRPWEKEVKPLKTYRLLLEIE